MVWRGHSGLLERELYLGDLFEWDVQTGKERRLSRGGGGYVPLRVTGDGNLYFQTYTLDSPRLRLQVRRTTLAAVREFSARELDRPPRTASDWARLVDDVFAAAGADATTDGAGLTPAGLQRLAETFSMLYRQRFGEPPPSDIGGFERQLKEVQQLDFARGSRGRLALVLGAVHGDYLGRQHGAVWRIVDGPLTRSGREEAGDGLFALAVNPFTSVRQYAGLDDADDDELVMRSWLRDVLTRAEGRTLVLTNDPDQPGATAFLADPDLERAEGLLRHGREVEADRVLLDLMTWKRHQRNTRLLLHIGTLLHQHHRTDALRQLMETQCRPGLADPRMFNLSGLALLDADPAAAAVQFRKALRCNLYYGPGYFNLSLACEKSGDRAAAVLCLRRYLKLLPFGPLAADARQRLAVLNGSGLAQR